MEKICRGCGEPFRVAKGNQSYCNNKCQSINGKSNRAKPSGWMFHGECRQCGKQFESDRTKKYCSRECQCESTLKKAREAREKPKLPCKQCGNKLPSTRKTFCSDECRRKYRKKTNKTNKVLLTDEIVGQRIAEHYDNIEHISGCKSDGKLVVRCKVCVGEFEIGERSTRVSHESKNRPCPYCVSTQKAEETKSIIVHSCGICGQAIIGKQANAMYCSVACGKVAAARQKHEKHVGERECNYCGKAFVPELRGMWAFCSESCKQKQENKAKRQHRHTRKALKKCNGEIDHSISLEKLIKRDKSVCHICGRKCDKRDFMVDATGNFIVGGNYPSIDHILPLSKGGSHTWNNIKLAHFDCNRIKSDALYYAKPSGQMAMAM